jgi:hypothetical protein
MTKEQQWVTQVDHWIGSAVTQLIRLRLPCTEMVG